MAHGWRHGFVVVTLTCWGGFLLGRPWSLALLSLVLVLWFARPLEKEHWGLSWPLLLSSFLLYALTFPTAWDHQWAVSLGLLLPLAWSTWLLGNTLSDHERFWRWAAVVITSASLMAIFQVFWGLNQAPSTVAVLPAPLQEVALARLGTGRAFGTLPLPGHFAVLQAFAAPFLWNWVCQSQGRTRRLVLLLILLNFLGCVVTRSLLGTGLWVLGTLLVLGVGRAIGRLSFGVGLAVLAGVVVWREDLPRLEPLTLRWINWKAAAWAFWHNPITGVGLGGIGMASLTSPWAQQNMTPFAHHTPLQLLAEFGLMGFPLVGLLFLSGFRLVFRNWRVNKPAAVALLVVLLHNFLDFSLYEPGVLLPFCLLAGNTAAPRTPITAFGRWLMALMLVLVAAVATLEGTTQALAERARDLPLSQRPAALLRAASFSPWRLAEVLEAAGTVWEGQGRDFAALVDRELEERVWVAPASATWAQARALLLLLEGRRAEAWSFAREAKRRAPWRQDLQELEKACRP